MTEDTGWPPAEPADPAPAEPDESLATEPEPWTPPPAVDADPQQVADEAAAAEPEADPQPVPDDPAPPPAVQDPDWLLDLRNQAAGSALLAFAEDVYRRLRNLGG